VSSGSRSAAVGLVAIASILAILSWFALQNAMTPGYSPRNTRAIAGSLSGDPKHGVLLEDVQICSCWQGPAGQAQKKVRFRITNNTDGQVFRLTGGPEGSIFLFVGYSAEFEPVITAPPRYQVGDAEWTSAGLTVFASNKGSVSTAPQEVTNPRLLEDLDPPAGWRVWAIPANYNRMIEFEEDGDGTFPTYVEVEDLLPGKSYVGDRYGTGVWTFYLPYPPQISFMADMPIVANWATTSYTDAHYVMFGVAVLDEFRSLKGFAPTPPESQWTDGTDF
jgi:hypothetical protein